MPRRKFEDTQLKKLVGKGFTVNQIADKLGVSNTAIRKRIRELEIIVSRDTALNPAQAQRIAEGTFNVADRLYQLHVSAMDILGRLEKVFSGEAPPESLDNILQGKTGASELYSKLLAETRKQLSLAQDIYKSMCDMREVMEFQRICLEVIKKADPAVQQEIVDELTRQQHLASSLALRD